MIKIRLLDQFRTRQIYSGTARVLNLVIVPVPFCISVYWLGVQPELINFWGGSGQDKSIPKFQGGVLISENHGTGIINLEFLVLQR